MLVFLLYIRMSSIYIYNFSNLFFQEKNLVVLEKKNNFSTIQVAVI